MGIKLGSLFDGIGGFPLAGVHNGITPVWASEIEAFPISVTKIRFPEMKHVGDITKLKGSELPPVDIVTGGSPCQDLSVASGKRAGLAGERSGLFMEQIRVIKEMRMADEQKGRTGDAVRPRYMVWENVPGAFSSGAKKGEDFRIVLEETARISDGSVSVPRPPSGVWKPAGAILGDKFSLAWRVLDTQYWPGTPQRRRRIFLVADFNGHTAPEILFKQGGLFGNTAQGENAGQETAAAARSGVENTGGTDGCLTPWDAQSKRIHERSGVWPTLYGGDGGFVTEDKKEAVFAAGVITKGNGECILTPEKHTSLTAGGGQAGQGYPCVLTAGLCAGASPTAGNIGYQEECAPTLKGSPGGNMMPSVICLNDQGGQRMDVYDNITGTLRAHMDGHPPLIMPALYENHGIDSRYTGPHEVAPTISARAGTGGNNVSLVTQELSDETYCIAGNIIGRDDKNGGNGLGCQVGISYTITSTDRHAIYAQENIGAAEQAYQQTVGAITRSDYKGVGNQYVSDDKCVIQKPNIIRRLTPLECERLMGFPDGWTDVGGSDSARYKALGNSVSIPCVDFVLRGIAYFC